MTPALDARWWKWPASGTIRAFGFRRYRRPDGTWHFHQGVDFPAREGSPIRAVQAGRVAYAHGGDGPLTGFGGYGRLVVLAHDDGTWTLYAHALNVWVRPGERVSEAQGIATVGRTCFTKAKPAHLCAGAHLHFEAARTRYPKRLDTKPADRGRFDPAVLFR